MSRRKSRRPGKPVDGKAAEGRLIDRVSADAQEPSHPQAELPVGFAHETDESHSVEAVVVLEQSAADTAFAHASQPHANATQASATQANPTQPTLLVHPASPSVMTVTVKEDETTLGQRLRKARQDLEWSREDMAQKLRLPTARITDIENDRFDTLGATVYARSYLLRYAKLVDVPEVIVRRQFSEPEVAAVVSRGSLDAAPSRRVQRVSHLAKYAVLTAVIMVPALMSVFNRSTPVPVQVRSLETAELSSSQPLPAPSTTPVETFAASFEPDAASAVSGKAVEANTQAPTADTFRAPATTPASTLAASMTPMMPSRPALAPGEHEVILSAREDSWMELIEVGGRRIDQGLLRAGESRRYVTRVPIRVRIGNSGGVELQADGSPVALAALARKNVANLELFGSSAAPASPLESAVPAETP